MLGFPRSGRNWQNSIHDVTRPAPALAQAPARPPPFEDEGHPGVCAEPLRWGARGGLRCLSQSVPGPPLPLDAQILTAGAANLGSPWEVGTESPVPGPGLSGIEWVFPEQREHPSKRQ